MVEWGRAEAVAALLTRWRTVSRFAEIVVAGIEMVMRLARLEDRRAKLTRYASRLNVAFSGRGLPALVLMTDDRTGADWAEAVLALPRASAVVVRHRQTSARAALALRLLPLCRARGILLLVADDLGLASRIGADGVHLPELRAQIIPAARRGNARWLVTVSAHSRAAVMRAGLLGADAVLVSPIFATQSHLGSTGLGMVKFSAMILGSRCPVYALGGIDDETITRLGSLALAGVALIGGWLEAERRF